MPIRSIDDIFQTLGRSFDDLEEEFDRRWSEMRDGGFVQIGGYKPPLIVQNFMQHARKIVPHGTAIRLNSTDRTVSIDFGDGIGTGYTYEAIDKFIVRCLDHLKSITKAYHESRAQASPANTDNQAGRRASASVVPAPGARRMLFGRAKGPEGGEG